MVPHTKIKTLWFIDWLTENSLLIELMLSSPIYFECKSSFLHFDSTGVTPSIRYNMRVALTCQRTQDGNQPWLQSCIFTCSCSWICIVPLGINKSKYKYPGNKNTSKTTLRNVYLFIFYMFYYYPPDKLSNPILIVILFCGIGKNTTNLIICLFSPKKGQKSIFYLIKIQRNIARFFSFFS